MPNVLEVQIIGDVSALEKSLKQAEKLQAEYTSSIEKTSKELAENIAISRNYAKAIEELDKELKSGSISSKEYSAQLSKLKKDEQETTVVTSNLRKELANLKREQKDLGNGFQKDLTPKIANGGNALMQFSRIAQDAPFGIAGIGNNITATVEAFGHLQKSTGSAGGALKAMAASIVGSGGILLAVSLLTTGLTYMAQNGLTVGDVLDKLTGDFDNTKKAIQEVTNEARKSAGSEIASMEALVSVAKDENQTREARLAAVQKLQAEYPAYFGNLSKEQILNGDVAGAVKDVTNALIAKAEAQGFADKIGENSVKILELQQKGQKTVADFVAKKGVFAFLSGASAVQLYNSQLNSTSKEIDQLRAENKALTDGLKASTAATIANDAANKKAADNAAAAAKAKADAAAKAKRDAEKAKKEEERVLKAQVEISKTVLFDAPEIGVTAVVTDIKLKTGEKDELGADILGKAEITTQPVVIPEPVTDEYIAGLERAQEAGFVFADATGSAIGALGNQIAASLETGNAALDAFVGSVIQSLADIAAAQLAGLIAQQAIATQEITTSAGVSTAKAIESGTKTAAASGPAAAFVLPALVGAAIGFIAASFAGIKFAHGGVVPGGSFTGDKVPAMLNSGETVMNSQQQANTLMAIANGNSNALQGNVRIDTFTLETALRGSDLLLAIKREEKKR